MDDSTKVEKLKDLVKKLAGALGPVPGTMHLSSSETRRIEQDKVLAETQRVWAELFPDETLLRKPDQRD